MIYLLVFLFLAFSIILFFDFKLYELIDLFKFKTNNSIKNKVLKKKLNFILAYQKNIIDILDLLKIRNQFYLIVLVILCCLSLGIVISIITKNFFLVIPISVASFLLPLAYLRYLKYQFELQLNLQLENSISIINSSYYHSHNLIQSIEESLAYIKEPLNSIFSYFLYSYQMVDSDLIYNLKLLKEKLNHPIFREWVESLIICQEDYLQIKALELYSEKLSRQRLYRFEASVLIYSVYKEFKLLTLIILLFYPFLYFINYDWFMILNTTLIGKIILAIALLIMIFSYQKVSNLCRIK